VQNSIINVSIQLGKSQAKQIQEFVYLGEDLSAEPILNLEFGIGNQRIKNLDTLEVYPSILFLRVLEMASFDGNIINFNPIISEYVNVSKTKTKENFTRVLAASPLDYNHNMDLIHYQLYCQDSMFLDRLSAYSSYLEKLISLNKQIIPEEFTQYVPLDFIGCNEAAIPNVNIKGCIWGQNSVCFSCDMNYKFIDYGCQTCQINLKNLNVNDHYTEKCITKSSAPIPIINVNTLNIKSSLDNEIYFLDAANKTDLNEFKALLLNENMDYIKKRVVNQYSKIFSNLKISAKTYKIDFSSIISDTNKFPLPIQIMQVSVFINENSTREIVWKKLSFDHNHYPYVVFTLRKLFSN
jgi:hypothetical protein